MTYDYNRTRRRIDTIHAQVQQYGNPLLDYIKANRNSNAPPIQRIVDALKFLDRTPHCGDRSACGRLARAVEQLRDTPEMERLSGLISNSGEDVAQQVIMLAGCYSDGDATRFVAEYIERLERFEREWPAIAQRAYQYALRTSPPAGRA